MGYYIKIKYIDDRITPITWVSYNIRHHAKFLNIIDMNDKPINMVSIMIINAIKRLETEIPNICYIQYVSRYTNNINDFYSILCDLYDFLNDGKIEQSSTICIE